MASDNCGTPIITTSLPSGFRFQLGVTGVLVFAADACGNKAQCEFVITVEENCCNKPPVIICPANYTACPGSSTDISVTGIAIADPFHTVCQQPVITFTDHIDTSVHCKYVINRIWKAVNPKNNAQTICTQTIVLQDVESPSFSFCPSDVTIDPQYNCDATVNWNPPVVADHSLR